MWNSTSGENLHFSWEYLAYIFALHSSFPVKILAIHMLSGSSRKWCQMLPANKATSSALGAQSLKFTLIPRGTSPTMGSIKVFPCQRWQARGRGRLSFAGCLQSIRYRNRISGTSVYALPEPNTDTTYFPMIGHRIWNVTDSWSRLDKNVYLWKSVILHWKGPWYW